MTVPDIHSILTHYKAWAQGRENARQQAVRAMQSGKKSFEQAQQDVMDYAQSTEAEEQQLLREGMRALHYFDPEMVDTILEGRDTMLRGNRLWMNDGTDMPNIGDLMKHLEKLTQETKAA